MRNRRRGQARLSAVSPPDGPSACAKAVLDAPLPAGRRRTRRAGLSDGALLRDAAVASAYTGGASDFRPGRR